MKPGAISDFDVFNGNGSIPSLIDEIVKQQNTPSLIADLDHVRSKARSFMSSLPRIPVTSMDVIMRDEMPPINLIEGDYVYFQNMGAYSTAYASDFNGFPRPEVITFQS